MAEYVIGMMITGLRRWHLLTHSDLKNWNRMKFMGQELRGKTIGIVGFGHIGRLIYQKLVPWQCHFIGYDPYIDTQALHYFSLRFTPHLHTLLRAADIITLHLPLTSATHHLISKTQLAIMKPSHILINTSRGGVVDETALLQHIKKTDSIYIADVFENEPLVNPQLLQHRRIITTPHIAAMTDEANQAMAFEAIENFLAHQKSSANLKSPVAFSAVKDA